MQEDKVLARGLKEILYLFLSHVTAVTMASRRLFAPGLSTAGRLRPISLTQTRAKATVPFRLPDARNEPNVSPCVRVFEIQKTS